MCRHEVVNQKAGVKKEKLGGREGGLDEGRHMLFSRGYRVNSNTYVYQIQTSLTFAIFF